MICKLCGHKPGKEEIPLYFGDICFYCVKKKCAANFMHTRVRCIYSAVGFGIYHPTKASEMVQWVGDYKGAEIKPLCKNHFELALQKVRELLN